MSQTMIYTRSNLGDSLCNNNGIIYDGKNVKNNYKTDFVRSGSDGQSMGKVTSMKFGQWFRTASNTAYLSFSARIIDPNGGWYLTSNPVVTTLTSGWGYLEFEFDVSVIPYTDASFMSFSQVVVVCNWNTNTPRTIRTIANSQFPATFSIEYTTIEEDYEGADAPTLGTVTWDDSAICPNWESSPLDFFGNYIQGFSKPQLSFDYTIEDDTVTYPYISANIHTQLKSGDTVLFDDTRVVSDRTGTLTFDAPVLPGNSTLTLIRKIEYPDGVYTDDDTTNTAIAYIQPTINLSAERWDYNADVEPVQDETGRYVWFNGSLGVTAINNKMPWKCEISGWNIDQQDTPVSGSRHQIASYWISGNTTFSHLLTDAYSNLTDETIFDGSTGWWFDISVTDALSSVSARLFIEQIAPYFNIEENGVSVGMMSTGTSNDKKFEVASDYTTHFFGDVVFHGNGAIEYINGGSWQASIPSGSERTTWSYTVTKPGNYLCVANVNFGANSTGTRLIRLIVGTNQSNSRYAANNVSENQLVSIGSNLQVGDTMSFIAYQSSGSNLNVNVYAWLIRF